MNAVIQNALKKALSSLLKGLIGWLLLVLGAAVATPIPSEDKIVATIAGLIVTGLHALISFLKRASEYDPLKDKK